MDNYNPPSQEIFNEMKQKAISIWSSYDNTYGYVAEKLDIIEAVSNHGGNAMMFFRMFDNQNQIKFLAGLSEEAKQYIVSNS